MQEILKYTGSPTIFFLVLAFVLAVGFIATALLYAAWRTRRQLERSAERIRQIDSPGHGLLDEIEEVLPRLDSLREQWQEFKEGIVEIGGVHRNTLPSEQFFVEDAVAGGLRFAGVPYSFLQLAPTMATGFGILGTFVGISLGLSRIDFQGDITTSVQLVLPALSSAFATSILGVFAAITIEFFANGSAGKMDSALHSLREAIDRKVERVTAEELLDALRADARDVGARIDQLVGIASAVTGDTNLSQIERRLHEQRVQQIQTNKLLEGLGSGLAHLLTTTTERQDKTNALLERLEDSSGETRDTIQQVAERVMDHLDASFTNSLEKVLGPHLQRLVEIVDQQVATASEQATDQSRRFVDEMVNDLKGSLSDSFEQLGGRLESASGQLASAGGDLQAVVAAARETVSGQEQVLDRGRKLMAEALDQGEAASQRLDHTQSVVSAIGDLSAAMQQQQAHLLENQRAQAEVQNRTEQQIAAVVELLKSHREQEDAARVAMRDVAVSMDGMLGQSQTTLSEVLGRLTGELSKLESSVDATRERADAGAEQLRETLELLNARLDAETSLLDGYRTAATGFSEAFERGGPTIDALAATANDLQRQQTAVHALSERLAAASQSVQQASDTIGRNLADAARHMEQAGQGFQQTVEGATAWADSTTQSIERFSRGMTEAVERSLTSYDSSLSTAVQSLATAIKELEDVAEELTEMASRAKASR